MVLFVMLCEVVLTFRSVDKTPVSDHAMKATEQYFRMVLFSRLKIKSIQHYVHRVIFTMHASQDLWSLLVKLVYVCRVVISAQRRGYTNSRLSVDAWLCAVRNPSSIQP